MPAAADQHADSDLHEYTNIAANEHTDGCADSNQHRGAPCHDNADRYSYQHANCVTDQRAQSNRHANVHQYADSDRHCHDNAD